MAKKQNLSYQNIETSLEVFKERKINAPEIGYELLKAFGYPFANDEARLECLFRMYEKMTTKK
jgi:hypothetical protein